VKKRISTGPAVIVIALRDRIGEALDHEAIKQYSIMISSLCSSMISVQTRSAFVARENWFRLSRIML